MIWISSCTKLRHLAAIAHVVLVALGPIDASAGCAPIEGESCTTEVVVEPVIQSKLVESFARACEALDEPFLLEEAAVARMRTESGPLQEAWIFFEKGVSCGEAAICSEAACEAFVLQYDAGREKVLLRGTYDAFDWMHNGLRARRTGCANACWDRFVWQDGVLAPAQ